MGKDQQQCPDCGGQMSAIFIVDKSHDSGGRHRALQFTLPGEKRSFFMQKFPIAGTVDSVVCHDCRRIFLYAGPADHPYA